jgi:hypothetical protein
MENPLLVFVSSVFTGMATERQAAQATIRAILLKQPWLFEFKISLSSESRSRCGEMT